MTGHLGNMQSPCKWNDCRTPPQGPAYAALVSMHYDKHLPLVHMPISLLASSNSSPERMALCPTFWSPGIECGARQQDRGGLLLPYEQAIALRTLDLDTAEIVIVQTVPSI